MRITAIGVFATGMIVFALGFVALALLGKEGAAPQLALTATGIVALAAVLTYAAANAVSKRIETPELPVSQSVRAFVWVASLIVSVAGAAVFLPYFENGALAELVQNLLQPDRTSALTEIEVRLSTVFMPMWAQILFELARRLALPICLIEFFVGGVPDRRRPMAGAVVLSIAALFVFGTLDRAIPLMYIGMVYLAWYSKRGGNPLRDRWFYVAALLVVVFLVSFKLVQYGEVRGIDITPNSTIEEFMGGSAEQHAPQAESGAMDYAVFTVRSTVERIVLSPMAMTLYAFESYDESNFLHWSSTRILSLLGFGRYVSPLEEGVATKYHDAFPVTFLGDLWRQGGFLYMPYFGAFLGLLLFTIDHFICRRPGYTVWKPLALMGVAFLFYGNALNATAAMLIGGSLGGHLFVTLMSRLPGRSPAEPDAKR